MTATNTAGPTKAAEVLLVSSQSPDPFSTVIVNARTGASLWNYKGSELQNLKTGIVHPIGVSGEHFLVSTHEKPLLHCLAFHQRDRFHAKSVVAGVPKAIATSKDGSLLFVAISTQVFTWLLTTGELLCVVDAHYQNITAMELSADDSLLFTVSSDGAFHVYLVSDMMSVDRDTTVTPLRKYRAHSLSTRGLAVSCSSNPRVLTCGLDHTAVLHSISLDTSLLKVSADRPLTACAMDPAEMRVFVGTDLGNIAQINLYDIGTQREILIQTTDVRNVKVPIFNGHSEEIVQLCVNGDGTLLASGDSSGKYCIWDIASKQCLRMSTARGPIGTLKFLPNWSSLNASEQVSACFRPNMVLQRISTTATKINITRNGVVDSNRWNNIGDTVIEGLLAFEQLVNTKSSAARRNSVKVVESDNEEEIMVVEEKKGNKKNAKSSNDSETVAALKKEVAKLKKINAELYDFASKELMTSK